MSICRFTLLAVLSTLLSTVPAAASCGTAVCPLDLNSLQDGPQHATGGLRLQLSFEAIDQDQPRLGTRDVDFQQIRRPDHDEIMTRNRNWSLRATFAGDRAWEVGAVVPIVHRQHSHVAGSGHVHDGEAANHTGIERWDFTALGDVVLRTDVRTRLTGLELRTGLGLRLPTGATDLDNSTGTVAEPALQPGTGGLGLVVDAGLGGSLQVISRELRWFASTLVRWNARGEHQYRIGAEWMSHAGAHLRLHDRVEWLTQVTGRYRGRDDAGNTSELVDSTGGSAVLVSPGLRWRVVDGLWLNGYWQLPVYEDVNGVQLTAQSNVQIGLTYQLTSGR